MSENKILLAGPWVGELGWELFCWQGYVRKLSRSFDKTIIISRPGHKYFYEDFCDEYIEFDPRSYKTRKYECFELDPEPDDNKEQVKISIDVAKNIIKDISHTFYLDGNFDIRSYKKESCDIKNLFSEEQEFFKYEYKNGKSYDLIFHCRNKSTGKKRNWDESNWKKLLDSIQDNLKIACIGNKEALHIEKTDDLRGIEIKELVGIFNQSKLIVGPSSGPMHLASLCGLTHLVWGEEHLRKKYEITWNPFKTKAIFYSNKDWIPEYKEMANLISLNFK